MKNLWIAIALLWLNINTYAQTAYQPHYFNYQVIDLKSDTKQLIGTIEIPLDDVELKQEQGRVFPIHISAKKNEKTFVGKVDIMKMDSDKATLKVLLPNVDDNQQMLRNNECLIALTARYTKADKETNMLKLHRLGIGIWDLEQNVDFRVRDGSINDVSLLTDRKAYTQMAKESKLVAQLMRDEMESPMVEEGRFVGMDLFSAMEYADKWDVEHFIAFMIEHPYKYQGYDWKFSEIFATWMMAGAKTPYKEWVEFTLDFPYKPNDIIRYFKGMNEHVMEKILDDVTSEIGSLLDNENWDGAKDGIEQAKHIAHHFGLEKPSAWLDYKNAKLNVGIKMNEDAEKAFRTSFNWFLEAEEPVGIVIVGNDYSDFCNLQNEKKYFKESIRIMESVEPLTRSFEKNDEDVSPVVALVYRNYGMAYLGLKKYDKALELFNKGLEYTVDSGVNGIRRRATIENSISILYGKMGKQDLSDEYVNKALETLRKYKDELKKQKHL